MISENLTTDLGVSIVPATRKITLTDVTVAKCIETIDKVYIFQGC